MRVIKRVFPFLGKIEMIEKRKERRARKERKGVSLNGKLFCLWIKICVYVLCEEKNETVELWSRKRNLWICFRFSRPNKKMWVVDSEVSFRIWVWDSYWVFSGKKFCEIFRSIGMRERERRRRKMDEKSGWLMRKSLINDIVLSLLLFFSFFFFFSVIYYCFFFYYYYLLNMSIIHSFYT